MGKLKFIASSGYLKRNHPELVRQLEYLDYVEETIKDLILRYLEEGTGLDVSGGNADSPNPEERDFYRLKEQALSAEELEEVRYRLVRLAHRLASLKSRRQKKATHGRVDLRSSFL